MTQLRQCRLRKDSFETIGWIEERGAQPNALVELKPSGEFWQVAEVFPFAMEESALRAKQAIDRDSLPSIKGGSK